MVVAGFWIVKPGDYSLWQQRLMVCHCPCSCRAKSGRVWRDHGEGLEGSCRGRRPV